MRMAHVIGDRSKDPNTQAGAVLVNDQNVVVGMGYNGWPRGIPNEALPWEREGKFGDTKYAYVVHAEENAIYNANANTKNCTLYCTLFPCNECVKTIIQCGVSKIVYESDKYAIQDIWKAAKKMLDLAGIKYRQYQSELAK